MINFILKLFKAGVKKTKKGWQNDGSNRAWKKIKEAKVERNGMEASRIK
jgi:hypothetical protein